VNAGRIAIALSVALGTGAVSPYALPTAAPATQLSPVRRAQEAAFLRQVKRNQTAEDMTANVAAHTGERVAYTCRIEEIDRPTVVVGQCGPDAEPVDLYLELPPGAWHVGDHVRVLGVMDRPATWSDISGHTYYYPFVKAVFVDRLRKENT